jgi:hypothetical protein
VPLGQSVPFFGAHELLLQFSHYSVEVDRLPFNFRLQFLTDRDLWNLSSAQQSRFDRIEFIPARNEFLVIAISSMARTTIWKLLWVI